MTEIDLARGDLQRLLARPAPALSSTATAAEYRCLAKWLSDVDEMSSALRIAIIREAHAAGGPDDVFSPDGRSWRDRAMSFGDVAEAAGTAAHLIEQYASARAEEAADDLPIAAE
jgi:hypothetical protein